MRIPDWIVFSIILGVVLWALFAGARDDADAPEPPPISMEDFGPLLPDANSYDDEVLVQVGEVADGIGTAFALDGRGVWLTARHVVDGCDRVGLLYSGNRLLLVDRIDTDTKADLAILYTSFAPNALQITNRDDLRVGEPGFHIGFPQGQPGEATSRLLARSRLISRGRYSTDEPVLAWAEMGRTRGIDGTLAGISGGPVFDRNGEVVGVTVAESPRRGRIYTAAPKSIENAADTASILEGVTSSFDMSIDNYFEVADRLREERSVVKVVCQTENGS